MRISLIVCTYRRSAAIKRLLQALRDQTTPPEEVLIVDASLDTSTETVVNAERQCWKKGNLHYFCVPPEHRGLTRQRNFGIARTKGEIIAFLDDDTVPESIYFEKILACFERHPEAIGIGGCIANEVRWQRVNGQSRAPVSIFRWGEWERREDYRWRLRKLLGLASSLPPGWMPPSGHGRSIGFLPPDGEDHRVEFLMGGASAWRRDTFHRHQFSPYFEGYGLYEDLDFCIRASRDGPLYLCTRARLAHYHAPSGRPNYFKYGEMVVRNGWYVWRKRWPNPAWPDRVRWWATTLLLLLCRLGDTTRGSNRIQTFADAMGRIWGILIVISGGVEKMLNQDKRNLS